MSVTSVLIAPDKFKGSLTAREVAENIAAGITAHDEGAPRCTLLPLADGGDGSVQAALAAGYDAVSVLVSGPTGQPLTTTIAFDGHTAVVEVASIAGLGVLPGGNFRPLSATSYGVGEALRFAVEHLGARRVTVALGGSACTDGGAGMLNALGAIFIDESGEQVRPAPGIFSGLRHVRLDQVLPLAGVELVGASDVVNPLLGPTGAATVFGPQKGASPVDVEYLEAGLTHYQRLTNPHGSVADTPGAGSAGGIGFALLLLGGRLVSGANYFLDLLDFDTQAQAADLIITGEGSLDEQTESGKLISAVTRRAAGKPVIAVAGRSTLTEAAAADLGLSSVITLAERSDVDTSHDSELSAQLLRRIGCELIERTVTWGGATETWSENEEMAEQLVSLLGRLRRRGTQLFLCGRALDGRSVSAILKAHRYTRHALGTAVTLKETIRIAEIVERLPTAPARIDFGDLSAEARRQPDAPPDDIVVRSVTGSAPASEHPVDAVLYGFGRIGRLIARELLSKSHDRPPVALRAIVVRPGSAEDLVRRASLLRRDSVHGPFPGTVSVDKASDALIVNGVRVQIIYADQPATIDYTSYGFSAVTIIDSTGKWRDRAGLETHLHARGANQVLLTAPGRGDVPNVVLGINESKLAASDRIVAAASCTTNAITPVLHVLDQSFGVDHCHVETVHSFTNDQNLIDNHHSGPRRGRSAVLNLVIAETGAARAVAKVLPGLSGRLTGNAIRVPTSDVSIAILNLTVREPVTATSLNEALRYAATTSELREQIGFTDSPEIASTDFVGSMHAGIIDARATIGDGHNAVVYVWYDNEYGYVRQVVRLLEHLAQVRSTTSRMGAPTPNPARPREHSAQPVHS